MKTIHIVHALAAIALLSVTSAAQACPSCWWDTPKWGGNWREGMPSMRRHHYIMNNGLPREYRSLENPLRATGPIVADGERIYEQNCASCHGQTGIGDGPAGKALRPKPANLMHLGRMSMMANDGYLYWAIAEGGKVVNSDMPAFKDALSDNEIWSAIHYIRRGL